MATDRIAAVAALLVEQHGTQISYSTLGALLDDVPVDERRQAGEEIRGAVLRLDALGLVRFAHSSRRAVVGVVDRDGLRAIAGGEPAAAFLTVPPQRGVR